MKIALPALRKLYIILQNVWLRKVWRKEPSSKFEIGNISSFNCNFTPKSANLTPTMIPVAITTLGAMIIGGRASSTPTEFLDV